MKFYLVEAVDAASRFVRLAKLRKKGDNLIAAHEKSSPSRKGAYRYRFSPKDSAGQEKRRQFSASRALVYKGFRAHEIADKFSKPKSATLPNARTDHSDNSKFYKSKYQKWGKRANLHAKLRDAKAAREKKSESVEVAGHPLEEGRTRVKRLMNKLHQLRSAANAHGLAHRAIQQYLNADGYVGDHEVPKLRTLKKISDIHFSAALRHHSAARKLDKQVNKVSYR